MKESKLKNPMPDKDNLVETTRRLDNPPPPRPEPPKSAPRPDDGTVVRLPDGRKIELGED